MPQKRQRNPNSPSLTSPSSSCAKRMKKQEALPNTKEKENNVGTVFFSQTAAALDCLNPFLTISEKVCLSMTSKTLYNVINQHQSWWTIIDFGACCRKSSREKLTDAQLKSLLIRTGRITRELSLVQCELIKGTGLQPLFGSLHLQKIDLRVKDHCFMNGPLFDNDLNCHAIMSILLSMPNLPYIPFTFVVNALDGMMATIHSISTMSPSRHS